MEPFYTVHEVAKHLKLTPKTIYRMLEDGRLSALKVGKSWRIRESDLEALRPSAQAGKEADA